MTVLAEVQAYCDERARRWALVKEKAAAPMSKMVADAQMKEALAIGLHVARLMVREKTT